MLKRMPPVWISVAIILVNLFMKTVQVLGWFVLATRKVVGVVVIQLARLLSLRRVGRIVVCYVMVV